MKQVYILFFSLMMVSGLSAQQLWDNFEDTRKGTYGFINGTFIPYQANPAPGGSNTSLVAAEYTRNGAEAFDVLILDGAMADLSDYLSGAKQMSIDVWSPNAGTTIQITLENSTLALPANFPTGRHSVYTVTTTVAQQWETLTFNFIEQPDAAVDNSSVDRIVLLFAPGTNTADTYYWDNLNGPELADDPCADVMPDATVLNDFECNQNVSYTFSHSGVNFRRVVNPDMDNNPSSYVATYTRNGAEMNDVIIGRFDGNLNVSSTSVINLDVWDPAAPTTVTLSLQNLNNDVILAVDATTSSSGAWESLSFDVGAVSDATDIGQFVILFDPGSNTSDQYYFDNFTISGSSSVNELAEVVSFEAFPNPTKGETFFNYELASASDVNLTIYDMTGTQITQVVNDRQGAGQQSASWQAQDIPNGIYLYTLTINGQVASGKLMLNR
jgi:hypothetical protein